MNDPTGQYFAYVPVPCVCDGVIDGKTEGSPKYDVTIDKSQLDAYQGPIKASPIYQSPLSEADLKVGDRVKVLVVFDFDVNNQKFISSSKLYTHHILGKYDPETILDDEVQNPLSERGDDRVVIKNKKSESGISMTDNFELIETPGGAVSRTLKAFGAGIIKNCDMVRAQNFHRIISHNDPDYPSREHFGLFTGIDIEDEGSRTIPEDFPINYRRFVQQTRDPSKWISSCEGAYAPWIGANNNNQNVAIGKEVLFTKIINNDTVRATVEIGEPGTDFIMMRVDEVIRSERPMSAIPAGATPGVVGNKFKMSISDSGAVEIYAAGRGAPQANFAKFKLTISEDGALNIFASDKIVISHGDSDTRISSITFDPNSGIEIVSPGFTVNGKKLVNENFITFLSQIGGAGIATSLPPGSPEPIAPAFLAALQLNSQSPDTSPLGFLTQGLPIPATGIITQADDFLTIG